MHHRISFIVSLALFNLANGLLASPEEKEFEVIPNPYDTDTTCFPNLDGFLEPYYLLTKPLLTQPDTFQELSYAKIMSVPVPVYRMQQPARISEKQLEFQLVLVKDLSSSSKASIQAVPVDFEIAKDSWFPGYYWSPLVMSCGSNGVQHVGWKFTALDKHAELPHFFALMVHIDDRSKQEIEIRIGGFKAPGWMARQITM